MAGIFRCECPTCHIWFGCPTNKRLINHQRLMGTQRVPCPGSGKPPAEWLGPAKGK